jgi:hypothetical protein
VTEAAVASPQREWWRRVRLVLRDPQPVFSALRDETEEDTAARSEPVLAIVVVAGIALVLSSSAAAHLYDDGAFDGLLVAVWAFLAGALYGVVLYWIGGLLLHFAVLSLGSRAPYRQSRQVLAFALPPLALSLVLWAPRLALYGGDSFRYDGADEGTGNAVFGWLQVAFVLWSLTLLVVGVRTVERWTWGRAAGAVAAAAVLPALVALGSYGVL